MVTKKVRLDPGLIKSGSEIRDKHTGSTTVYITSGANPHHFDANPDPAFNFDVNLVMTLHLMSIRIRLSNDKLHG